MDCPYQEDEENCQDNQNEMFYCSAEKKPIPFWLVCDFHQDCLDKSDEMFCGKKKLIN